MTDQQQRISVVVPTYERHDLLRLAIESLLNQTRRADEIIIVNDGGDPPTSVAELDQSIRLINLKGNNGPSAARNAGVQESIADIIFFLDDDDLFTRQRIANALASHAQGYPIVVCGSHFLGEEPAGSGRQLNGYVHDTIADSFTSPMGATSVRRSAWIPFDESLDYGEDIDWWIRITDGQLLATIPHSDYIVRRHDGLRDRTSHKGRADLSLSLIDHLMPYLSDHPRALAFRYRRLGHYRRLAGNRSGAFHAHLQEARYARDGMAILRALRALTSIS